MQIRDLELKTGLDRATIRYYEKEGLITPDRKENGYRDYTQSNLDDLMKIKLLRQLGMSLDRIKAVKQGSMDLQTVLEEQIRVLDKKIQEAERAKQVCLQMKLDGVHYDNLNVNNYLEALKTQSINQPLHPFKESVQWETHPVRRYLARWLIDYNLTECLIRFILIVILRIRPFPDWLSRVLPYFVQYLMVPLGALMLRYWGTTPGKWCMGIQVDSENGGRLTFRQSLNREWNVLRYGYGFGIPIWNIWCLFRSYKECTKQQMDWDCESEYRYTSFTTRRKACVCAIAAVTVMILLINATSLMRPKYQGDITVKEFASNYNHYLQTLSTEYSRSQMLDPDGRFYKDLENEVAIYLDGTPENTNISFDFETEGEGVREIYYSNRWSNVFFFRPITNRCYLAALTAVMSQDKMNWKDLKDFTSMWETESAKESAQVQYGNVHISWTIEAENCIRTEDGYYYSEDDDAQDAIVGMEFVIEMTE